MKVGIIIPAYNEEKSIGNVLKSIEKVMKKNRISYEVIVIDDGSIDNTIEIAKKNGLSLQDIRNHFRQNWQPLQRKIEERVKYFYDKNPQVA